MSKSFDLEYAKDLINRPSLEEAKNYCKTWLEAEPQSLEALNVSGLLSVKQQNFKQALDFFNKAILLNPSEPTLHNNIANVYIALGNIEKAKQHLNEVLRFDQRRPEAYNNLGRLYFKQNLISDAIPLFEKALRLNPDYWEAHYNLAHSFIKHNQFNRAAEHYHAVIQLVPNHPTAHFNLGLAHLEDQNYAAAEEHLAAAWKLTPDNLEAAKQLGHVFVLLGKTEKAIQTYESILSMDPNLSEIHHNLAILYLRNDEREKATQHFERALVLQPKNETAEHMLKALQGTQTPEKASSQYVTDLFDQYADYYDDHLKNTLHYQVPFLLRSAVGRLLKNNPMAGRLLDLGCGTGLCGVFFRDLAREMIGVDLSPKMIEKAKALVTYEQLLVADFEEYLHQPQLEPFDFIIAGDVLVYLGDLSHLFKAVSAHLTQEGRFAFTTEILNAGTYALQPTGRFAHSRDYLHELAHQNGLMVEWEEPIQPREQAGTPLQGQLMILRLR